MDADGNAYLTGDTRSLDFPVTPDAFDTTYNSEPDEYESDAFVAKLGGGGGATYTLSGRVTDAGGR